MHSFLTSLLLFLFFLSNDLIAQQKTKKNKGVDPETIAEIQKTILKLEKAYENSIGSKDSSFHQLKTQYDSTLIKTQQELKMNQALVENLKMELNKAQKASIDSKNNLDAFLKAENETKRNLFFTKLRWGGAGILIGALSVGLVSVFGP